MYRREPSPQRLIARVAARRGGFSLIELLIVIVIIAILASLITVAAQDAMATARTAAAIQDLKNIEKAIADFKLKFGVEPPSFIILYERATGAQSWAGDTSEPWRDAARRQSRALIREMWPQYDFGTDVDIDKDGTPGGLPVILNGAECLAFFLGGVQETVTIDGADTVSAKGFSANPANPFGSLTGNRIGPFMEFDPLRFIKIDTRPRHMIHAYRDSLPSQTKPIQYFSSYGGQGYRLRGINAAEANDDEAIHIGGLTLIQVYCVAAGTFTSDPDDPPSPPPTPFKHQGYQLISPGVDGEYGWGGFCSVESGCSSPPNSDPPWKPSGTRPINYERDNITNFKGGTLN